jgi:hypothetical protein
MTNKLDVSDLNLEELRLLGRVLEKTMASQGIKPA